MSLLPGVLSLCGLLLLACSLGATVCLGQIFEPLSDAPKDARFGEAKTQRWQVGLMITAVNANCLTTLATVPVPTDWPEQDVREVNREVTGHVSQIRFRTLDNGVKQMLVVIPKIANGQTAQAVITYEVTRREILPPSNTDNLRIPKRPRRDVSVFLGDSPFIETSHSSIKSLAKKIVAEKEKESDWKKVRAIFDWVRENIEYTNGDLKGARAALRDGNGDCEELTSLFIALCRAKKIPARTVWIPDHCYPEFYLEDQDGKGRWFPCEMTGGDYFGRMPATKPVLQKGDKFKVPEKKGRLQRYVAEWLKVKGVEGPGNPEVRFIRKLLDE